MNVLRTAAFLGVATILGACSSTSSGGPASLDPDFAEIQARFDRPSGTISSSNVGAIVKNGGSRSTTAKKLEVFGGSSGGSDTSTQSLRPQNVSAFESCSSAFAGQGSATCACPNGGSVSWHAGSGQADGAYAKIVFASCGFEDSVVDGHEYVMTRSEAGAYSMILVIDATVKQGAEVEKLDLQARWSKDAYELALRVDDGWVTYGMHVSKDDGSTRIVLRGANGSWTCVASADGHGTCTSDAGESQSY